MDFNSGLISLILLFNIPGFPALNHISVNCEPQNICTLRETSVILKCFYKNTDFKMVFWFSEERRTNWRTEEEPEDLILDLDYSGRVNQWITYDQSQLIIRDLRETDSGEYRLMFIMKDGVKRLSSVTVSLTVTVLQVKIHQWRNQEVQLTCDTSCLSSPQNIYWKKDGRYIQVSRTVSVSFREYAAYSCLLTQDHKNSSDPVCLADRCWNVIYSSRRVCALVGSTVDIPSTYSLPTGYTVEKTFWHYIGLEGFIDLREEQKFAGRVEYVRNTLRIKELKTSDSGEYRFRIITNTSDGKYSGSPGVILTVTDTQVKSSPFADSNRETVILSCLTECTLDNNHIYIWYKNGTQVTDGFTLLNKLYLDSVSSEEIQEYSCAVGEIQSSYEAPAPERSMTTRITVAMLSVLLILALVGALWYRRRKIKASHLSCEKTMKGVQPDSSTEDNAAPLSASASAVCDCTQQIDVQEQEVHYSSVNFKQSPETTSPSPTVTYSCAEDVYYATVKLK